jgi:hypothetical protein
MSAYHREQDPAVRGFRTRESNLERWRSLLDEQASAAARVSHLDRQVAGFGDFDNRAALYPQMSDGRQADPGEAE